MFMAFHYAVRYTPPTREFEVMIITCNPGEDITIPQLPVPSVFIVIEGSGNTDNEDGQRLVMRPGRCYLLPHDCPPLTLAVNSNKRGPLRIALAHENQHIDEPTLASAADIGTKQWAGEFALPSSTPNTPKSNGMLSSPVIKTNGAVHAGFKVPPL
jgi:quercetin dioxygenase-like cupin family protein